MVTVLENLVSELKRSVSRPNKSFLNIPVIDLPKPSNLVKYYKVEGIKEEYFDKLNGTIVTGLPKGSEPSRRVINRAGKTEHNFDGTVKRERVTVPRELLPVISGESLSLPYSYKYRDNQYIDFLIEKSGKKKYIYAVNKRNLYELNMVSLVLSRNRIVKSYSQVQIQTWEYGKLYLSLVPYVTRETHRSRTLSVGLPGSFTKAIPDLYRFWIRNGIAPNPEDFGAEYQDLLYRIMEGDVDAPEVYSELSVAETSGKDLITEEFGGEGDELFASAEDPASGYVL